MLATIYIFYTIPLQAATSLLDPNSLDKVFPGYKEWLEGIPWFDNIYSGLASALIFTLFFSLCPVMFKFIANFGSNATSQFHAEYTAMQVSDFEMVVTMIVLIVLSLTCCSRRTVLLVVLRSDRHLGKLACDCSNRRIQ